MSTTSPAPTLPKSFLYVPAIRPDRFDKAFDAPSEAVILDLEDSVPASQKADAREAVASWFRRHPDIHQRMGDTQTWARINANTAREDLHSVVREGLTGIFLPKCSLGALEMVAHELRLLEVERALPDNGLGVIGLIEDAAGILDIHKIARGPRLVALGIGEADLLGDLRIERTDNTAAVINSLRLHIVLASARTNLAPPVGPTSTQFKDLDEVRTSCAVLRDLGFRSRTAIHPRQVGIINDVLAPTEDEIATARDVLSWYEASAGGVTTDAAGHLIDAATVKRAYEIMRRSE